MSIENVVSDGIISDWDLMEKLWEHGIVNHLKVNSREVPVMFAEKSFNSPSARQK